MNQQEFMKQLEELLTGISPEEREEALAFYTGYFEDAGEENEAKVIEELESPEKLAASIKAGLRDDAVTGAYTENGYQEKSEMPQDAPMEPRKSQQQTGNRTEPTKNNGLTIVLIAIIAIVTSPLWLGLVGGIFGLIAGFFGVLIGIVASLFGITAGFMFGGVACIVIGALSLFTPDFAVGIAAIGIGLLLLAVSMLTLILLVLFCGKALPAMVRGIVKLCQMPFERKKRGVHYE